MLANYEEKLNEIKQSITDIGTGLVKSNTLILEALKGCEQDKFNEAKIYIKNVSKKTSDIDNNIITTLALHSPEARDLRNMVSYLKITNELLRASTNTRSFIKDFADVCGEVDINTINEYAIPMQKSTVEALENTLQMINIDCVDETQDCFNKVLIAENKTDDLYEMIETDLLKQSNDIGNFTQFHKMLSALRKSEKIADRAMSIASLLLFAKVGGDIHQV
ncbi:MAG: PhoU family transcriptional regulator [Campylobacterota bacterium]|nr:PhoU family transcriptional regulator [Campylobacterota bacterium]